MHKLFSIIAGFFTTRVKGHQQELADEDQNELLDLSEYEVQADLGHSRNQNRPLTKNPVRGGPRTGIWRSVNTPRNLGEAKDVLRRDYQGKSGWQGGTLAESKQAAEMGPDWSTFGQRNEARFG
jgi:NDP-sugar pyrophosphorylase family protein